MSISLLSTLGLSSEKQENDTMSCTNDEWLDEYIHPDDKERYVEEIGRFMASKSHNTLDLIIDCRVKNSQ